MRGASKPLLALAGLSGLVVVVCIALLAVEYGTELARVPGESAAISISSSWNVSISVR